MVCVDATHVQSSRSADADPTDSPVSHSFRWVACETSGEPPAARFSHSATIFPCGNLDEEQRLSDSVREHTRMLIYGGIGQPHDLGDINSLRISSQASGQPDLHWEVVTQVGPHPGRRHGHTMVHLPQHNMCVLFGGLFSDSETHEDTAKNDMWCLFLDGIHHNTPLMGGFRDFGLSIHWEQVPYESGPAPSPRSRQACTVTEDGVVLIFGGVNETLEGTNEDVSVDTTSILQKQKDSLMYSLRLEKKAINKKQRGATQFVGQWLSNNQPSTFSCFAHEPAVCVSPCSLNRDILMLLSPVLEHTDAHLCELLSADMPKLSSQLQLLATSAVLTPDTILAVTAPTATDFEAIQSYKAESTVFGVFGSLVATRSEWLQTILTSSMVEAQTRRVDLQDTDPHVFKLLLVYFYCDIVAYSSVDELYGLLVLADQFHIESLSRRGEGVLMRHLSEDNVCYLLEIADFLSLELLKTVCIAQLLSSPHIYKIVNQETILGGFLTEGVGTNELPPTAAEVDCETLMSNFNGLREELRQEVLAFCGTDNHVYKMSLQAPLVRAKGGEEGSVVAEKAHKTRDGN
jgi:hypothetical protein